MRRSKHLPRASAELGRKRPPREPGTAGDSINRRRSASTTARRADGDGNLLARLHPASKAVGASTLGQGGKAGRHTSGTRIAPTTATGIGALSRLPLRLSPHPLPLLEA